MSKPAPAKKVKLILSAIYSKREVWLSLIKELEEKFGEIDYFSKELAFNFTNYYEAEMGAPLFREFISFSRLMDPEKLVEAKIFTNRLEEEKAEAGKRMVNLDPGYLSLDHLVLATGKPAPHRIYLREGIWADLHLIYESGSFRSLPWTYPDYGSENLIALFNRLRAVLKLALKAQGGGDAL